MRSAARIDAREIAHRVAEAIGDGCVVLRLDDDGATQTIVAVDHRDPARRAALAPAVGTRRPVTRGWSGHVVLTGRPVRLPVAAVPRLVGMTDRDVDLTAQLAGLLFAPLRADGRIVGSVVALRDRGGAPYALREQVLLERLLARVIAAEPTPELGGSPRPTADDEAQLAAELAAQLRDRSDAAVWATDLRGRTLAVTPALCELVAVPIGGIAGLPMSDFLDPPPSAIVGAVADEPERGDRRLLRADGEVRWVETSSTPLVDGRGRRRGTLTTLHDVTERKRLEIDLRLRVDAASWLARLLAGVLRGDDPGQLLRRAAEAVRDVLGVWRAGVLELRRDGTLLLRAGSGWPADAIGRLRVPMLGSPAALALTGDEPVAVPELEPGARGGIEGARSGCWVGIGGRGVLVALHDAPRDYDREERELMSSLAEALSGCVGVARRTPRSVREAAR